MPAILLAMLLQTASISGSLATPPGMTPPSTARVVLLPLEYANIFNAQAQHRIDDYWEDFKNSGMAQRKKELFTQFMAFAYSGALEVAVSEMRRDSKINSSNFIKTASQGQFEFRGVPPGEYKVVATATIRGTDYVWQETLQVESAPILIQLKNRAP